MFRSKIKIFTLLHFRVCIATRCRYLSIFARDKYIEYRVHFLYEVEKNHGIHKNVEHVELILDSFILIQGTF